MSFFESLGGRLRDRFDDYRSGGTMAFQGWLHNQVSNRLAGGDGGAYVRQGLQRGTMQVESLVFEHPSMAGNLLTVTISDIDASHPRAAQYLSNFIGHTMDFTVPEQHLEAAAIWAETDARGGDDDDLEGIDDDD